MNLNVLNDIEVRENEPLCNHSTFKIGGNAKIAVFPKNIDELINTICKAKESSIKFLVVGNASNLLFDDEGFDGIVIFTKLMDSTEYIHKNNKIYVKAECGKSISALSSEAGKRHSLTGLEFAYGIPGTVGGAVYMNAGAYGGQISDLTVETKCFDLSEGKIRILSNKEQNFDYRHSVFMENPNLIILSVTLEMNEGNAEEIYALMNKNMSSRREKQPLEFPSAGSTFKRPTKDIFAGKLIEDSSLKGYLIGGAQISEKHAGFIINKDRATSADVLALIEHTKKTVAQKFGINLECELIYVPK